MINLKKFIALGAIATIITSASITVFAEVAYKTPAEILADLTGKSVEEIVEQKTENQKTYGAIAKDENVLDEFKEANLEMKKAILAQKVEDGIITQEEADKIIKSLEERQLLCDGTGQNSDLNCNLCYNSNGRGKGLGRGNKMCSRNFGN